jgi:putative restriction endonuclease
MATRPTRAQQIERLIDGLVNSGFLVVNDFSPSDRPVSLTLLDREGGTSELRVFSWNVTSGGRNLPGELRVQATRAGNVPLYVRGTRTLVLGYDDERDLFVAWDAERHPNPSESPSLQVRVDLLDEAATKGFAARPRPLGEPGVVEIITVFRPELIGDYLALMPDLDVTDPAEAAATAEAASGVERPLAELPGDVDRRRTISRVSRLVRNAQFRSRVVRAYRGRCAFCGLNAGLVEAAHIRPVQSGGVDQVRNGLAACPTHHAALDRGLIVIDDDYTIRLNEPALAVVGANEDDVRALRDGLRRVLWLPDEETFRPAAENLVAHRLVWESEVL